MSKANWVRKLLVVYVKLDINNNNQGCFEIVRKLGTEVVDYVSFRVHYGRPANMPQDKRCFLPNQLSDWCSDAMKWVAGILKDHSERQFKSSYLYEMMKAPPMNGPKLGIDGADIMDWLLRKRP